MSLGGEMNTRMRHLLGAQKFRGPLDPRLAYVLRSGFTEEGDCVLLSALHAGYSLSLGSRLDRTGLECFVNHLHIGDYFPGSPEEQLRQAMLLVEELVSLLARAYPNASFRVIVTQNRRQTTVRFRKVRSGNAFLATDLEKSEDEAVWTYQGAGGPSVA